MTKLIHIIHHPHVQAFTSKVAHHAVAKAKRHRFAKKAIRSTRRASRRARRAYVRGTKAYHIAKKIATDVGVIGGSAGLAYFQPELIPVLLENAGVDPAIIGFASKATVQAKRLQAEAEALGLPAALRALVT